MTTGKSGIPVNSQVTKPTAVVVNAKKLSELRAELATLSERVVELEAIRDKWRVAFEKADFYIGCTIEDKELLAWQEYNEAKKALYSREGE